MATTRALTCIPSTNVYKRKYPSKVNFTLTCRGVWRACLLTGYIPHTPPPPTYNYPSSWGNLDLPCQPSLLMHFFSWIQCWGRGGGGVSVRLGLERNFAWIIDATRWLVLFSCVSYFLRDKKSTSVLSLRMPFSDWLGYSLSILWQIVSGVAVCPCLQIDGRFFTFSRCL